MNPKIIFSIKDNTLCLVQSEHFSLCWEHNPYSEAWWWQRHVVGCFLPAVTGKMVVVKGEMDGKKQRYSWGKPVWVFCWRQLLCRQQKVAPKNVDFKLKNLIAYRCHWVEVIVVFIICIFTIETGLNSVTSLWIPPPAFCSSSVHCCTHNVLQATSRKASRLEITEGDPLLYLWAKKGFLFQSFRSAPQ